MKGFLYFVALWSIALTLNIAFSYSKDSTKNNMVNPLEYEKKIQPSLKNRQEHSQIDTPKTKIRNIQDPFQRTVKEPNHDKYFSDINKRIKKEEDRQAIVNSQKEEMRDMANKESKRVFEEAKKKPK